MSRFRKTEGRAHPVSSAGLAAVGGWLLALALGAACSGPPRAPSGRRVTNAEVVFVTRGSLEAKLDPGG
jgi:hypothetical protein